MASHFIELSAVRTDAGWAADKFTTKLIEVGPTWVNADKIVQFAPVVTDNVKYTHIQLGGEDYALVAEDPHTILILIEKARADLAQ
jgi:hypothetical protein